MGSRPMSIFEKVIDIVEETVKRALVKDLLRDSSQVVHLLPTGTTELRIARARRGQVEKQLMVRGCLALFLRGKCSRVRVHPGRYTG